jgi:phosphoglycolate phosphatase/pyrophosphatase PpaX
MHLRYRCLVVDHDDTSVMSTPGIHYPAHVEAMRVLRPGTQPVSLEGFLRKSFDPGFYPFLTQEIGLDGAEVAASYEIWRNYTAARVPRFFPGVLEVYARQKARGGLLVVVSHSEVSMIERDYRAAASDGPAVMPDLIFGWDEDPRRRKPDPYPVVEAMRSFGLARDEVLVLDDLKPGADMASAAGVDFAAAGWGHAIEEIKRGMRGLGKYYFEKVEDMSSALFDR